MHNSIDALYQDLSDVLTGLLPQHPSLHTSMNSAFSKLLLIAVASHFEACLAKVVMDFVTKSTTAQGRIIAHLVQNKVIERNYHTWFSWKVHTASSANPFFAMFGDDFKKHMVNQVKQREDIGESIKKFVEIGHERNTLAHEALAVAYYEKTSDDVYDAYKQALLFVEWFPGELEKFSETHPAHSE